MILSKKVSFDKKEIVVWIIHEIKREHSTWHLWVALWVDSHICSWAVVKKMDNIVLAPTCHDGQVGDQAQSSEHN